MPRTRYMGTGTPVLEVLDGVELWRWADGTVLPIIAGGAPEGDGNDPAVSAGAGGGSGAGAGGGAGTGGSGSGSGSGGGSGDPGAGGSGGTGGGSGGGGGTGGSGDPGDLGEAGKRAIASEREARAKAEEELKATRERLQALEDRDKTELEKATSRAATLEAEKKALEERLSGSVRDGAVTTAAEAAGALYPSDIPRLLDTGKLELEADGTPKAESLKKALEALRESRPALFRPHSGNGSGEGGTRAPAATAEGGNQWMNDQIRAASGRGSSGGG